MSVLIVPPLDETPWPTLGPQLAAFLEERCVFGPGPLKGQPARLDAEKRAALYRMYEVYPPGHQFAGRRRFKRCGISWRKGLAKTEFMAWVAYCELHPEGPVRADGFDADGDPVGVPVNSPYIPMLAVTQDQVEELAYGALLYMCQEGPDADFFDAGLERIIRLDEWGRGDGEAKPLANSPGSRDGARTTFQCFDEPHRLFLPRQIDAHETMVANLEKRALDDPWGLYVGTSGEPGQESVAEGLHFEAEQIAAGEITDPQLFYFHREADAGFDLSDLNDRVKAVASATGPAGEYGPGQFLSIARQWDRPKADKAYLERVWLNRWVKSGSQAFDSQAWNALPGNLIPDGAMVTVGFDGARFRDSTGIVVTDLVTGCQRLFATWERPIEGADDWEIDEAEVTAAVDDLHRRYKVVLGYADPPHWTETVGSWAGRWPGTWMEWWTNRPTQMAEAVRAYAEAIAAGTVTHEDGRDTLQGGNEDRFARHIAAAGRKDINQYNDDGSRKFVLAKIHPDRKFDNAMAAVLSWKARLDAISKGMNKPRKKQRVIRAR